MAKNNNSKTTKPLARGNTDRKSHPMVPRAGANKGRTYPYGGRKSNN